METYKKLNENELEVTKVVLTPAPVVSKYERSFIEEQIVRITQDKEDYIAKREAELAECQSILAEMNKLNIVSKIKDIKLAE